MGTHRVKLGVVVESIDDDRSPLEITLLVTEGG